MLTMFKLVAELMLELVVAAAVRDSDCGGNDGGGRYDVLLWR